MLRYILSTTMATLILPKGRTTCAESRGEKQIDCYGTRVMVYILHVCDVMWYCTVCDDGVNYVPSMINAY